MLVVSFDMLLSLSIQRIPYPPAWKPNGNPKVSGMIKIEAEDVALAVLSCVTHLRFTTGSIVNVNGGGHL